MSLIGWRQRLLRVGFVIVADTFFFGLRWADSACTFVGASPLRRWNFDDRRRQLRRRPGKPLFQIVILRLTRSQVEAPAVVADLEVNVIR